MSRATDLRDAIRDKLTATFTDVVVSSDVEPTLDFESNFERRIICWNVGRQIEALQGASRRRVSVNIAFVGKPSLMQSTTEETRRTEALAIADGFDEMVETTIALFSPNGFFFKGVHAKHRFESIEQPEFFDLEQWRSIQVWQSNLIVNFLDTLDE